MDTAGLLIAGLAAVAILLIAFAISRWLSESELEGRILRYGSRSAAANQSAATSQELAQFVAVNRALDTVNRLLEGRTAGTSLSREIARANLQLKVSEFLILWAVVIVAVPLAMVALSVFAPNLRSPLVLLVGMLSGAVLPRAWLSRRQRKRLAAFNDQLADTITLIANALRSGSSFLQACEMVTRETTPPVSTEFARMIREVNLGLPFEAAVQNMADRVRSDDLELLATAILIQYQVGGNLAEVLDSISFTIRERIRILGEIRTLTAQQRLSGLIVGLMPIALLAFLVLASPRFLAPMFANPPDLLGLPAGVFLLGAGALMMAFGFLMIRRIIDIDL